MSNTPTLSKDAEARFTRAFMRNDISHLFDVNGESANALKAHIALEKELSRSERLIEEVKMLKAFKKLVQQGNDPIALIDGQLESGIYKTLTPPEALNTEGET